MPSLAILVIILKTYVPEKVGKLNFIHTENTKKQELNFTENHMGSCLFSLIKL